METEQYFQLLSSFESKSEIKSTLWCHLVYYINTTGYKLNEWSKYL